MKKRLLSIALAAVAGLVLLGSNGASHAAAVTAPAPNTAVQHRLLTEGGFVPNFIGEWPPEAKAAWDLVAKSLEAHIGVVVPVNVDITWEPIEGGFLGKGGNLGSQINFDGAPMPDTWYPIALANQVAGIRLAEGADIGVQMNSTENWDFSGNPQQALAAGKPDFVSTLMHEIIHGMGFLGTANVNGDMGSWGDDDGSLPPEPRLMGHAQVGNRFVCAFVPSASQSGGTGTTHFATTGDPKPEVWDHFVVNSAGQSVLDTSLFPNPSPALLGFLTSNDLFWSGPGGSGANGNQPVKLFAPPQWQGASSYSHLDDGTYDGGPDALLTSAGENLPSVEVGPRVLGMLSDMGWHIH